MAATSRDFGEAYLSTADGVVACTEMLLVSGPCLTRRGLLPPP